MRNRQEDRERNTDFSSEESRRPSGDSGFDSSTGRSGSMGGGSRNSGSTDIDLDRESNGNRIENDDRSRRDRSSEEH